MKLIGLSGPAGVGKDTIADYLCERYGFVKFSFADPLYKEVAEAFGVTEAFLMDRANKEKEQEALQYHYCKDTVFQDIMFGKLIAENVKYPMDKWCSPRWILQTWGTEYRRAQCSTYWIDRADAFVREFLRIAVEHAADETKRPLAGLIQTSVRFPNERAFIDKWNGEVWHVRRPGWEAAAGEGAKHQAEAGLPIEPRDKVVYNDDTIERLHTTSTLLLAAEPGALYYCKPMPVVEAVTCRACGYLHRAVSRIEAQVEVKAYGKWYSRQTDHVKRALAKYPLDMDSYVGCQCCEGGEFDPANPKLIGPMTPPVIYEPEINGHRHESVS